MNEHANMSRQLRGLALSEANRRHLLALPFFKVDRDLPEEIHALLRELEAAESAPARR